MTRAPLIRRLAPRGFCSGRIALAAIIALCLALSGFAHRPLAPAAPAGGASLAEFFAMGGAADDLCISGSDEGGALASMDCPVCTLAKSMALATRIDGPAQAAWRAAPPFAPALQTAESRHQPRAPPARGPPSPLMT